MKQSRYIVLEALTTGDKTANEIANETGLGYYKTYTTLQTLKKSGHVVVSGTKMSDKRSSFVQVFSRTDQPVSVSANPNPAIVINVPRELRQEFQMTFPNMAEEVRRLMRRRLEELRNEQTMIIGTARYPMVETTHT